MDLGAKCKQMCSFTHQDWCRGVKTLKKTFLSGWAGHYERKIKDLGKMVGEETTILNVFSPSTSTSHFEEKPSLLSIVLEQLDLESLMDLA